MNLRKNGLTHLSGMLACVYRDFLKRWPLYLFGVCVCVYCIATLRTIVPYCFHYDIINDDLRQHLLPFYAKMHPENFSDMFLVNYSRTYLPWAYNLLFSITTFLGIDPMLFSKLLGVVLVLTVWLFSFLIGKRLGGLTCGFMALLLVAHGEWIVEQTFVGLFRSFSYPLLMAFIYFWLQRKIKTACGIIFLTTLLYPPIFFICCGAFALEFIIHPLQSLKDRRKELIVYCVTGVLSLGSLLVFAQKPEEYGKPVTIQEASKMAEWSRHGGRFRELPLTEPGKSIYSAARLGLHSGSYGVSFAKDLMKKNFAKGDIYFKICFFLLIIPIFFCRPFPFWFFGLLFFSIAMYFAARLTAFSMGWPDRYLRYCLPALSFLAFPVAWNGLSRLRLVFRYPANTVLLLLMAGTFIVYPFGMDGLTGDVMTVEAYQPMLKALREYKEPMLIAGWPGNQVDNIALYAQKEVLVDYEHAHPIYKGYYSMVKQRITDTLFLIFAIDEDSARRLRDKYGLTHLIIEPCYYDLTSRSPRIFMPYNELVYKFRRLPPGVTVDYVFDNVPEDRLIYSGKHFQIVDLSKY